MPKPVVIDKQAAKWLLACRDADLQDRLRAKIRELGAMLQVAGVEKIQGSRDIYRVRVGDYRIVYQWAAEFPAVLVTAIAHRREVYRRK